MLAGRALMLFLLEFRPITIESIEPLRGESAEVRQDASTGQPAPCALEPEDLFSPDLVDACE